VTVILRFNDKYIFSGLYIRIYVNKCEHFRPKCSPVKTGRNQEEMAFQFAFASWQHH